MSFERLARSRRSHRSYVPGRPIAREQLEQLLAIAAQSPSAYNQQGWSVVVIASPEAKTRFHQEACPQQQVLDCSAVVMICGDLEQYKNLPEVTSKTPSMGAELSASIVRDAAASYSRNPEFARDEAIRSASFFAMSLMLAATDQGLGTCPMGGFDRAKAQELFALAPNLVPVLLVSIGLVDKPPFPQGFRRPVATFARFV